MTTPTRPRVGTTPTAIPGIAVSGYVIENNQSGLDRFYEEYGRIDDYPVESVESFDEVLTPRGKKGFIHDSDATRHYWPKQAVDVALVEGTLIGYKEDGTQARAIGDDVAKIVPPERMGRSAGRMLI